MKMSSLFQSIKRTNTVFMVFVSAVLFFLTACTDSSDLEYEVQMFQQQVDSILVNVIVPKKDSLHAQIEKNEALNQKNIDIAYQVIPINTAQFLISSQSDSLYNDLKLFKSKKLKASVLKEKLNYSKFYVDSILISNVVQ